MHVWRLNCWQQLSFIFLNRRQKLKRNMVSWPRNVVIDSMIAPWTVPISLWATIWLLTVETQAWNFLCKKQREKRREGDVLQPLSFSFAANPAMCAYLCNMKCGYPFLWAPRTHGWNHGGILNFVGSWSKTKSAARNAWLGALPWHILELAQIDAFFLFKNCMLYTLPCEMMTRKHAGARLI